MFSIVSSLVEFSSIEGLCIEIVGESISETDENAYNLSSELVMYTIELAIEGEEYILFPVV